MKYVTSCYSRTRFNGCPDIAVQNITIELTKRIVEMKALALGNQLSEVQTVVEDAVKWVLCDGTELNAVTTLHVTPGNVWFSCAATNRDTHIETVERVETTVTPIDVLVTASLNDTEILYSDEYAEDQYLDVAVQ